MGLESPLLFFSMPLDNTPSLNAGRLFLIDYAKRGIVGRWVATSGLGAWQKIGGFNKQGGGVIPPSYECNPSFSFYWVDAEPVDLSHVKGVEGNGYQITPFEVRTKSGVERSDLLIHKDANVPGSMGCIVLSPNEFEDFEEVFRRHCPIGKVKLLVGYTF
jgi:hypothetical protein